MAKMILRLEDASGAEIARREATYDSSSGESGRDKFEGNKTKVVNRPDAMIGSGSCFIRSNDFRVPLADGSAITGAYIV